MRIPNYYNTNEPCGENPPCGCGGNIINCGGAATPCPGPRGPQGIPGPQGPAGPAGATGPHGALVYTQPPKRLKILKKISSLYNKPASADYKSLMLLPVI